jgi:SAM-dependent methyltransferase
MRQTLPPEVTDFLICPRDGSLLSWGIDVSCEREHQFPIVGGIPVLFGERDPTGYASSTIERLANDEYATADLDPPTDRVDAVVQDSFPATNGILYRHLAGKLDRYPIPEIRLPFGDGRLLLDVGGGWGRWTVAAARAGYRPIVIDPSLDLLLAAARVSQQLGVDITAICGDATALPFVSGAFDVVFSYSVLQHFSKAAARVAMAEMRRVTTGGGTVLVQLANRWGARQLFTQSLQFFRIRNTDRFRVRYWSAPEMAEAFDLIVGPSSVEVDGFFSLNVQPSDLDLMPSRYRALIHISEWLRGWSRDVPALCNVADSLYVRAVVPVDQAHRDPAPPASPRSKPSLPT